MWLLPTNPDELGVSLPEGVHLLPGHYGTEERSTLLVLLRSAVPRGTRTYVLDGRMADEALRRGVRFPGAVVLVHEINERSLPEQVAALAALDATYLLVQPEVGEEGTAWLEGVFKVPLLRWLRQELRRPDHPLAPFGVAQLNVLEAGANTADPVRFLATVTSAVEHRMRFARVGTGKTDWGRSLSAAMRSVTYWDARVEQATQKAARELIGRLLHIGREIALIVVDTHLDSGWDPDSVLGDARDFPADEQFARDLYRITAVRFSGLAEATPSDRQNLRQTAARMLANVSSWRSATVRGQVEWMTFVEDVLTYFASAPSEVLAGSRRTTAWVLAWARRKKVSWWRRHCIANVAMALSHALARGRRVEEDVRLALEVLSAVEGMNRAPVGNPVRRLRSAIHFVLGEGTAGEESPLLPVLRAIESSSGDDSARTPETFPRSQVALTEAWRQIARYGATPFELALVREKVPAYAAIMTGVACIGRDELDEAIDAGARVLAGSDDDVMPIERAFAREIIGTAQARRGDVDAAIEAFSIARETYVALEDAFRIRNVDEQIAALRASG